MTRMIGLAELVLVLGLLLLGAAVWLWAGVPAVLAYAGTVAILVAIGLGWLDGRRHPAKRVE